MAEKADSLFVFLTNLNIEQTDESKSVQGSVHWLLRGDDETPVVEGSCRIQELSVELEEHIAEQRLATIVLLLDDSLTLYIQEIIPGKSASQIRRAAPFAIEGYLSNDLEETHLAMGNVSRGEPIECLAIENDTLTHVLEALAEQDVFPTICTTVGNFIPQPDEEDINVVVDDSSGWIRTKDQIAVVSSEMLAELLDSMVPPREDGPKITIWNHRQSNRQVFGTGTEQQVNEQELNAQSVLFTLSNDLPSKSYVNLLQGKFSKSAKSNKINLKGWINTGLLALICFFAYMGLQTAQGIYAYIQKGAVDREAAELYESIYEAVPTGRNVRIAMQQNMGSTTENPLGFTYLIDRLAQSRVSFSLNEINYREGRGTLDFEVEVTSPAVLDDLVESIKNNSIEVEIDSYQEFGDYWIGRISMKTQR